MKTYLMAFLLFFSTPILLKAEVQKQYKLESGVYLPNRKDYPSAPYQAVIVTSENGVILNIKTYIQKFGIDRVAFGPRDGHDHDCVENECGLITILSKNSIRFNDDKLTLKKKTNALCWWWGFNGKQDNYSCGKFDSEGTWKEDPY
jgi:hypothetical protein